MFHSIGEIIKAEREQRYPPLSQAAVARRCGISPGYLSRIEQGEYLPSVEILNKISDGLGLNKKTLLDEYYAERAAEVLADALCLLCMLDEDWSLTLSLGGNSRKYDKNSVS